MGRIKGVRYILENQRRGIKGVRYILGKQGTINFTFFRKIEYVKFSNRFVANNSVLMIVPIMKLVGQDHLRFAIVDLRFFQDRWGK